MASQPITRERIDAMRATQKFLDFKHKLLSELHRRFPDAKKLKRLPQEEADQYRHSLFTILDQLIDSTSVLMEGNKDAIEGMESILARDIERNVLLAVLDRQNQSGASNNG